MKWKLWCLEIRSVNIHWIFPIFLFYLRDIPLLLYIYNIYSSSGSFTAKLFFLVYSPHFFQHNHLCYMCLGHVSLVLYSFPPEIALYPEGYLYHSVRPLLISLISCRSRCVSSWLSSFSFHSRASAITVALPSSC